MGMVLWELLFRQHPFLELPMGGIAREVVRGRRPAVPAAMAGDEYVKLMQRCWEQQAGKRPSMREVYESLREICQTQCPMLAIKLLPAPVRVAASWRERHQHDQVTAPSVTVHSLSGSACGSADAVPRVACMLVPLKQQEVLWVGLECGRVGFVKYQHGNLKQELLLLTQCQDGDKHRQRVTAISHLCRSSEEEGSVWTGSEDGSIHVWTPRLQSLEEIHDANTLRGRLLSVSKVVFIETISSVWVECEHGVLSWFGRRHDLVPIRSLRLTSLRSVFLPDPHSLCIMDKSDKYYSFREPEGGHENAGLREWHRVLTNILSAQASSARGITRLAAQRQAQHG